MITTNVVNYEFRYLTSARRYPFSDNSTYTDTTGRILPYSSFIDGILYPGKHIKSIYLSRLFIYGENKLAAEFSNEESVIGCIYDVHDGSNYIIEGEFIQRDPELDGFICPKDSVIGVFVITNVAYIKGLALISQLAFTSDTMSVDSSIIFPVPHAVTTLTVNGTAIPLNKDVVFSFSSEKDRFVLTDIGMPFISYKNFILNKNISPPVKAIVPSDISDDFKIPEEITNAAFIYAPHIAKKTQDEVLYNDLRIAVQDSAIHIFKVGDDK